MRRFARLRGWTAVLGCLAVAVPPPAYAMAGVTQTSAPLPNHIAQPSPAAVDVALRSGGLLVAQLVGTDGHPLVTTPVTVLGQDGPVATTSTDANGLLAVVGLRGATYRVVVAGSVTVLRAWAPGTAPPAAADPALIVIGDQVVRGQCPPCPPCGGRRPIGRLLRNPWVIATLVGAAIAIPIATADDDDGPGS